ncbi:MAG: DinB family protein [Planctomycetota bacterium]
MIASIILQSAALSLGYSERLLKDIAPETAAQMPQVDGKAIQANHPTFIFGHLSLYPSRIVVDLGGDATPIQPTDAYQTHFSPQATCQDDPNGNVYPTLDEVTSRYFAAMKLAIAAIEAAEDSAFAVENPNERMRAKFATKGSMHNFYLGGHVMIHMGQLSTWRRVMGLGPA